MAMKSFALSLRAVVLESAFLRGVELKDAGDQASLDEKGNLLLDEKGAASNGT